VADYELLYGAVIVGVIAIFLVLFYFTRTEKKKKPQPETPVVIEAKTNWLSRALKTEHTITTEEAKKAKDDLRILNLEREILSFSIRRLYEAQAEGKITEEERQHLATNYKSRMMQVRNTMERSESMVALHELEAMQEDLVKLFSDRFDELGKKLEELRTRLQVRVTEQEELVSAAPTPTVESLTETKPEEKVKKKVQKKTASAPPRKTEAEERIDAIKAEVEKVLERLGQIEVEGEK
jgi:hypothetical protein